MRVDHARELGAHGLRLRCASMPMPALPAPVGTSSTSKMRRCAGDDRRQRGRHRARRRRARGRASSRAARSSSSSSRATASVGVLGFDRARIGRIDEDQPAVRRRAPRPARAANRSACAAVSTSLIELFVAGGELGQLALDAADVAQPQHRAAADGAAFRLDRRGRRAWSASSTKPSPSARSASTACSMRLRRCPARARCRRRARAAAPRAGTTMRGVAEDVRLVCRPPPRPPAPAAPTAAAP